MGKTDHSPLFTPIKLAAIALWPIGRMIVTVEEAEALSHY